MTSGWCRLVPLLLVGLMASSARGQTAAEKAQAQALFDEARALMKEGNVEHACDKFADSQKLDPAVGTQLNLAVCYEKLGRTASAWALFLEVRSTARRAGQSKRAELADRHAQALEPRLARMLVQVGEPVPGMTIARGGTPIAEAAWGSPVPVDPGEHVIRAEAPGKKPWETRISVSAEGDTVTVEVPPLESAPRQDPQAGKEPQRGTDPPAPARGPDAADEDGSLQRVLGWTAGGVGVAAVGVGVVLRVLALGKDGESNDYCLPDDPMTCTPQGAALRDDAQSLELGSTIAWIGGGSLIVTGIVLLLTAPDDGDEATAEAPLRVDGWVGPHGGALGLRLSF